MILDDLRRSIGQAIKSFRWNCRLPIEGTAASISSTTRYKTTDRSGRVFSFPPRDDESRGKRGSCESFAAAYSRGSIFPCRASRTRKDSTTTTTTTIISDTCKFRTAEKDIRVVAWQEQLGSDILGKIFPSPGCVRFVFWKKRNSEFHRVAEGKNYPTTRMKMMDNDSQTEKRDGKWFVVISCSINISEIKRRTVIPLPSPCMT